MQTVRTFVRRVKRVGYLHRAVVMTIVGVGVAMVLNELTPLLQSWTK